MIIHSNGIAYRIDSEEQLVRWIALTTPAAVAAFLRTLQVVESKAA